MVYIEVKQGFPIPSEPSGVVEVVVSVRILVVVAVVLLVVRLVLVNVDVVKVDVVTSAKGTV